MGGYYTYRVQCVEIRLIVSEGTIYSKIIYLIPDFILQFPIAPRDSSTVLVLQGSPFYGGKRERRSPRMGGLVPCIAVSTFVIFLTIFLAEALRRIVAAFFPNGLVKNAVLEFVAAAEMCGCGFELIISK